MEIHKSAEDYLETILKLQQQQGQVRSIDIVGELHYSKPSVSVAMKKLRESGHVVMDENGLLKKGVVIRHLMLPGMWRKAA